MTNVCALSFREKLNQFHTMEVELWEVDQLPLLPSTMAPNPQLSRKLVSNRQHYSWLLRWHVPTWNVWSVCVAALNFNIENVTYWQFCNHSVLSDKQGLIHHNLTSLYHTLIFLPSLDLIICPFLVNSLLLYPNHQNQKGSVEINKFGVTKRLRNVSSLFH